MEKTLIKDLTETQILSAVREAFAGERVAGVSLQPLIDQSQTLGDLFDGIRRALDQLDDPGH